MGGSDVSDGTTVLLVDDHQLLRQTLRRAAEEAGYDVVGEAGDGEEGLRLAEMLRPAVVLMDVTMPVLDGIEATRLIRQRCPQTQVVVLTMHSDPDVVRRAIDAGASGYVVKDSSIQDVLDALRMVAEGNTAISPELASSMLTASAPAAKNEESVLSKREEEVLQMFAKGHTTVEVAAALFISAKTVKNHLASIYSKLDARDRTQAIVLAARMGIIRLD
jgi:DNA-binding NarL/FixJ family response regulator